MWTDGGGEMAVAFLVFGATGSATVAVVRPLFTAVTGVEGSLWEGPWEYRIGSVLMVSPCYAAMLGTLGTLAGRHPYFARMAHRMLSRFVPSAAMRHVGCEPARAKWARDAASR